jgi:3-dehydroquinate synthase
MSAVFEVNDSVNMSFQVPFTHQLRFTRDVATDEFEVLLNTLEGEKGKPPKVMIVVDGDVYTHSECVRTLGERLVNSQQIDVVGNDNKICLLVGGEAVKNTSTPVKKILTLINQYDLDRRSYIIVIGGGAILDAVGFAAATAHRGIRLVRLPTTTLAQADSGVGVKNAINYFGKKNWVGTFAVPWAVINDSALLKSLPDRDFRCGFSEAVKVSLLKSKMDFDFLCQHATKIRDRDMAYAFPGIQKACLHHLYHITQGGDPFEVLEARPLDYGHWSAHKMEPLSDYQLRHGEAVGIGVALDCIYSHLKFGFPQQCMVSVCRCLHDLGVPLWDETLNNADAILQGLEEFRQHLGGRLTITMLRQVADPFNVHDIDVKVMRTAIEKLYLMATHLSNTHPVGVASFSASKAATL